MPSHYNHKTTGQDYIDYSEKKKKKKKKESLIERMKKRKELTDKAIHDM